MVLVLLPVARAHVFLVVEPLLLCVLVRLLMGLPNAGLASGGVLGDNLRLGVVLLPLAKLGICVEGVTTKLNLLVEARAQHLH